MNDNSNTSETHQAEAMGAGIKHAFIEVIFRPDAFFSAMPRSGGFREPLIFMVAMGVASGLVKAVLGLAGLGDMSVAMALAAVVIAPVLLAVFGFVVAAVIFLIWKIMGSDQDYETAYRCIAYGSAISPATQLLNAIPYIGLVLGLAWWALVLVVASVRVHRIRRTAAMATFGIIALFFAMAGVGAQITAHRMVDALKQQTLQNGGSGQQDAGKMLQNLGKMMQNMNKQQPASGGGQ